MNRENPGTMIIGVCREGLNRRRNFSPTCEIQGEETHFDKRKTGQGVFDQGLADRRDPEAPKT